MDAKGKSGQAFSNRRVAIAFLAAPMVPVALFAIWFPKAWLGILLFGIPTAYFATALIAFPLAFALRAWGKLNAALISLVGALTTVLPFAILGASSAASPSDLLPFIAIGACGGLAGWLIAAGFSFKVDEKLANRSIFLFLSWFVAFVAWTALHDGLVLARLFADAASITLIIFGTLLLGVAIYLDKRALAVLALLACSVFGALILPALHDPISGMRLISAKVSINRAHDQVSRDLNNGASVTQALKSLQNDGTLDLYNDLPLHSRCKDSALTIWSVGPDLVDDGGKPIPVGGERFLADTSPWSFLFFGETIRSVIYDGDERIRGDIVTTVMAQC